MRSPDLTQSRRTRAGQKREGTRGGRTLTKRRGSLPTEEDVFASGDEVAAAAVDPRDTTYRGVGVLVVDPQEGEDGVVLRGLYGLGLDAVAVRTGLAAREALGSRAFHAVFLVLGPDPTWARLLLQLGAARTSRAAFFAVAAELGADVPAELLAEGVTEVLEPPLPGPHGLLLRILVAVPAVIPPDGSPAHALAREAAALLGSGRQGDSGAEAHYRARLYAAEQQMEQLQDSLRAAVEQNAELARGRDDWRRLREQAGESESRALALERQVRNLLLELGEKDAELSALRARGGSGAPAGSLASLQAELQRRDEELGQARRLAVSLGNELQARTREAGEARVAAAAAKERICVLEDQLGWTRGELRDLQADVARARPASLGGYVGALDAVLQFLDGVLAAGVRVPQVEEGAAQLRLLRRTLSGGS